MALKLLVLSAIGAAPNDPRLQQAGNIAHGIGERDLRISITR
jgi:hypothetical protein